MFTNPIKALKERLAKKATQTKVESPVTPAKVQAKKPVEKPVDPRFVMEDVGKSPLVFYRNLLRSMGIVVPEWLQQPVTKERTKKRKVFNPHQPSTKAGWWNAIKRGYHFKHNTLYRNTPKRDKSISARQWRIRRNRARNARIAYNTMMAARNF